MAKPKIISRLLNKDYKMFEAFRCVGHLTTEHLKGFGMTQHRIDRHVSSGWIRKDVLNTNDNERIISYTVTREGYKKMRDELDYSDIYKPQSIQHDLKLADIYCDLEDNHRNSWITETQMRRDIDDRYDDFKTVSQERYEEISDYSPCDGGYVNENGEIVLVEITTSSYSREMIQEKINFAEIYGATYYEERV